MWTATSKKGTSVIQHRIVLASAAGLACAFMLAACDSSNGGASGTSAAGVTSTASAPATSATGDGGPAGGQTASATTTEVRAEAVKGGGSVVTDGAGATLYRYDKDRPNPSRWTCAGECVKTWIPVIVPDSVRTVGVEKSLLGTVHRDGRKQLTLGGWPLYRYVGDTGAGQVNGQGKDGRWYAVAPGGGKSDVTG